ncbi:alcohol dehydrogenase [Kaistia algarum]|uniref:glycerol dehydrogenase n=1 Tax=Kaistia algarum TaxID=2083279 RepID=UPI000CE82866|nr:glycerol dehydrogenase [Kaistia algarum]MCX5513983.1 glycerol dehydrogenase [Kaistia algarum]PPE78048.1 alcohol dehydrogenase [Kaistia algarum]
MSFVFGAPGRYVQGPGILDRAGEWIAVCGRRAIVLADRFVLGMIEARVRSSCERAGVAVHFEATEGEVTEAAIADLGARLSAIEADVLIAAGGGKCIDTGKAISHARGVAFISLPTVASNDAPTSKNYVVYDETHQLLEVRHLPASPRYVVVDTELIAAAPRPFLLAGIGDALTKKFEAEQCLRTGGTNMFGARPSLSGVVLARECYTILRANAEAGLRLAGTGRPDAVFEQLIEAVLLMSGLGFESGGLSIAHAMTRGLSKVPGAREAQHGLQVAYALLVQLALEADRDTDFFDDLYGFYDRIGLPKTLAALGADRVDDDLLAAIAVPTLAAPHARNFERPLAAAELVAAMRAVEAGEPKERRD